MIIGTAGHIDHGKTSLVKAITGVDADRLQEEKARGITIDLGYAYHDAGNGQILGFVDVPGHERFVHNMVAGATGIDFVLLVVAADDGPMPQTREHLDIVHLLGLNRGAVVLTKIDRVAPTRLKEVFAEIDALLRGTSFDGCCRFSVSNVTGEGIDALKRHLIESAGAIQPPHTQSHFRMAVDRCFTLTGAGTVVTGTVHGGGVKVGDRLCVSPSGIEVRVRGIHAQNRTAEFAHAGQRCALNIAGVEKHQVHRGDWVLGPQAHAPAERLDTRLRILATETRAMKQATPVHVHLGTADVTGQAILLDRTSLEPGEEAWVQLVLDKPIAALRGDRFVVRDQSAQRTIGGGKVLDPFAPARRRRTVERQAILAGLEIDSAPQSLRRLLETTSAGIDMDWFLRCWNHLDSDGMELSDVSVIDTASHRFAILSGNWDRLRDGVVTTLGDTHKRSPDVLGLNSQQLRKLAAPQLPWELFTVLIDQLITDRVIFRQGAWFHLPDHKIQLAPTEKKRWQQIERLLAAEPFQPPRVRDIARTLNDQEGNIRSLLQRTTLAGETVFVAHDHYFLRDAVIQLARIAVHLASTNSAIRAADFRDHIGTGRKLAIHILECFDRIGFLKRVGDDHFLRNPLVLLDEPVPLPTLGGNETNTGRDSYPGGATGLQIR